MTGLDLPIHRIPLRSHPITPAPALMPQHDPTMTNSERAAARGDLSEAKNLAAATGEEVPTTTAPSPGAAAAADQTEPASPIVRRHARGNRITLTVPDEILAVADLTGRPAEDIVADLLACQVSAIRSKASRLLGEVVL